MDFSFFFAGFASAFWEAATLGDGMLFAISTTAFGVLLTLTAAGAIAFAYLANRPMPTPDARAWAAQDGTWKGQHR